MSHNSFYLVCSFPLLSLAATMSCRVHMIKIKNIIKFDNLASENVEYKMMLSSMSSMTFHHELMGFEFLVAILNEWLLIKFDVNFIA